MEGVDPVFAEIKGLNEECGVFAIWDHPEAAQMTYYGLHSLQHRGQEGAGIVVSNQETLRVHKGVGLVNDVFTPASLKTLSGRAAIGHVRYATAGGGGYANVQPLLFNAEAGGLSLAHNGNLTNAKEWRQKLEAEGAIFQSSSDTEVIAHLMKRSGKENVADQLKSALARLTGAFAVVVMTESALIIARDGHGLRPLALGRLGDAYVVASETCALDIVGATFVRDVAPGELIVVRDEGMQSESVLVDEDPAMCSMEYVYFARPDSNIDTMNVHTARKNLGKQLALEAPVEADIVTGVPDSSISAAIGYAEQTGIPYELGLIKNRYVGRTFIQPSQALREQGVKMKLSPVRGVVEGKRVVMIDDSIVRGTTSCRIVRMLREAGAKEVHVRIAAPPIKHPCFYGIDISTSTELIAAQYTIPEMCAWMEADSLAFLSVEGLKSGIGRSQEMPDCGQCLACFTGEYPTNINKRQVSQMSV